MPWISYRVIVWYHIVSHCGSIPFRVRRQYRGRHKRLWWPVILWFGVWPQSVFHVSVCVSFHAGNNDGFSHCVRYFNINKWASSYIDWWYWFTNHHSCCITRAACGWHPQLQPTWYVCVDHLVCSCVCLRCGRSLWAIITGVICSLGSPHGVSVAETRNVLVCLV